MHHEPVFEDDMTETNPFDEFAKAMATTAETAERITKEMPEPPAATGIRDEVAIDRYVDFLRWMKEKKAADAALVKAHKQAFEKAFNDVVSRVAPPVVPGMSVPNDMVLRGDVHAVNLSWAAKNTFDEIKLRELDFALASSGGSPLDPVPGLQVKYTAKPENARDGTIAAQLLAAIDGEKVVMSVEPVENGGGAL